MDPLPQSDNLIYSLLVVSDVTEIKECNTGNVGRYFFRFTNQEETQAWVEQAIREMEAGTKIEFAARDRAGQFIGLISLHKLDSSAPEVGMWIAEDHQRKGYGRESLRALIGWAWRQTPAKQLIYETERQNNASFKLAKSVGFIETTGLQGNHLIRLIMNRPVTVSFD